jgi:hypothetical protein
MSGCGIRVALVLLLLALVAAAPTTRPSADLSSLTWQPHGQPANVAGDVSNAFEEDVEVVKAKDVLADPAKYEGRQIWMTGDITAVCAKAGCWVKLMPDGQTPGDVKGLDTSSIFVKLTCPKEGFLVPISSKGQKAIAHGEIIIEEVDEATARHYAADDGATETEQQLIQGPQTTIRLMTPGVWVAGR